MTVCFARLPICTTFPQPGFVIIIEARRTVEQECRALTRLRHPSIVSRPDFSLEDSPRRLATEFISGSTLRAYSKDQIILPVVMVRILRLLLEALNYAHGEGAIHRDLSRRT